jgi:hypothetical protein
MKTHIDVELMLKALNNVGPDAVYPVMKDGFLRSDFRDVFIGEIARGTIIGTFAYYETLEREWPRLTDAQQHVVCSSIIRNHIDRECAFKFLKEHGAVSDLHALFKKVHSAVPLDMVTNLRFIALWASIVKSDVSLLSEVLAVCPGDQSDVKTLGHLFNNALRMDDASTIAQLIVTLSIVRATDVIRYTELLNVCVVGIVGYGRDYTFIPRLVHAGVEMDPVPLLDIIAKTQDDAWPTLLQIVTALINGKPYKDIQIHPQVQWDKSWIDPVLGGRLADTFIGWMEKKKNRIPRELFSTDFVAALASLPSIKDHVPNAASRLYDLWEKNLLPGSVEATEALGALWQLLSEDQRETAIEKLVCQINGLRDDNRKKLAALIATTRALSNFDDPSVFNHVIPLFDDLISRSDTHLRGPTCTLFTKMTVCTLGADAVTRWVQIAFKKSLATGVKYQGAENANIWLCTLCDPENASIIAAVEQRGKLPALMADMVLTFLCDPLFSFHPYREGLRQFIALQRAIGNTKFETYFDAAIVRDVGKPAFASLLSAIAPDQGANVWSTIESLYHDDIESGTLLRIPEVAQLLRETVVRAMQKDSRSREISLILPVF